MKRMLVLFVSAVALMIVGGCASTQSLSNTSLAQFTHNDLLSAANYATANGYPARGAVYTAIDEQLTACENAISAASPKVPASGVAGAFTAFEIGAEAVGTGVPASVKVNCEVVTLPTLVPVK